MRNGNEGETLPQQNMAQKPLVVLTGPTAVGKTSLSLLLAKRLSGEIVSADSMQVYRGMDIGSAKITPQEMQGVSHHLIDILSPTEPFDAYRFKALAKEVLEGIYKRGHLPIVVGGTGFYIQALLYDIAFTSEEGDGAFRRSLEAFSAKEGNEALHSRLAAVDPQAAAEIHSNNRKRIIRALEYYHLTGERISEHNAAMRRRSSPYAFCYFVLNDDRSLLYQRIEARVDEMLVAGLVDEVKRLRAKGVHRSMTSMQGIGYREIYDYLEGELSYEEAVALIKRNTRHFAKRQLTWFRREKEVIWVDRRDFADEEAIARELEEKVRKKLVCKTEK